MKELNEKYFNDFKILQSKIKKIKKEFQSIKKKLPKTYDNEIRKAKKEKRKRKGPNNGGFQLKKKVPKKIQLYLNLEENIELTRPEVVHLMNEKFKSTGERNGKKIILNKNTAKHFGLGKKKFLIEFSGFQTFIAKLYNEENVSNTLNV